MSSVLNEICEAKKVHVEAKKKEVPLFELETKIQEKAPTTGFISVISECSKIGKPALIAEVKKASPSKGVIREAFDPLEIAKTYEASGATCLSVLTDEPYFQGKDEYLLAIKKEVALPVLRKDFMVDEYQFYEARALGADCVLLIMAALSDAQAKDFYALANELGMDVLVEVHDDEELERAIKFNPAMIGVNNRNLKTLEVDIKTSERLSAAMPENTIRIAESGIYKNDEIKHLQGHGFHGFLVGESLMRQEDIGSAVRQLLTGT